jgi:membrane protein implicated in regulation of membrane protease activity
VLGGASLIAGLVLLLDEVPWLVVIPAIFGVMAIAGVLATMAYRVRKDRPLGDTTELIGRVVPVSTEIGPSGGKVVVDGVFWSATSPTPIAKGAKARIRRAEGLVLEVEPA